MAWPGALYREEGACLGLPGAPCGYPIVNRQLCWTPGLYVTGALAALEIGPVARHIIDARLAATRLLTLGSHTSGTPPPLAVSLPEALCRSGAPLTSTTTA